MFNKLPVWLLVVFMLFASWKRIAIVAALVVLTVYGCRHV
jgi:hypothetical protein